MNILHKNKKKIRSKLLEIVDMCAVKNSHRKCHLSERFCADWWNSLHASVHFDKSGSSSEVSCRIKLATFSKAFSGQFGNLKI